MSGLQDVEQAIISAIKTSVAFSWHFISTYVHYVFKGLLILIPMSFVQDFKW